MGIYVCLFGIGYLSIEGRPTSSQRSLNWLNERNIQFITGIWVIWIFAHCQPLLAGDVVEHALGSLPALGSTARGYYVSPDKSDVAVAMRNGTSEVVASLAGPGPAFSRILPRSIRWIENRIVYIASNGGDYFLVDGKSKIKLPGTPVETAFDRPLATEDRRHYVLFVAQKNGIAAWVDGKPSKPQYERILFVRKQQASSNGI